MINKRKFVLLLLCLTIYILALSACDVEERLMEHFPEWVDLQRELSELEVSLSIEMEFQGINFEAYSADGEMYDEVLVRLVNTGDQSIYKYEDFGILFLYNNKWYGVYSYVPSAFMDIMGDSPGYFAPYAEEDISFLVPSGLFDIPGQYKLWNRSIGFCDIDIVFVPK